MSKNINSRIRHLKNRIRRLRRDAEKSERRMHFIIATTILNHANFLETELNRLEQIRDEKIKRDNLVFKLNQIAGVSAKIDGDNIDITADCLFLQYRYGELIACGQIILAENRTPEQVLSIVKTLVE